MIKINQLAFLATMIAGCAVASISYAQQNYPPQNLNERNFERADFFRERAKRNAQSDLEYPFIPYQSGRSGSIDYMALTNQIQLLAAQLNALAAEAARLERQNASAPGLDLPVPGGSSGTYGPDGPTEKSVAVVLEYRLMVSGNPRLKVGPITDEGENIRAQIVTEDGALVDEYLVNKANGVWSPVRD